jgi:2-dehydro-3-deoxyglucarate aldolase
MFKNNKTKEKLISNQLTIGSWITLAHMSIPEIMAPAGFDWLVVDMEHSVIDINEAQVLISQIEANGMAPLVRVGESSPYLIKRVMDAGAYGVIVPMVNSRADAESAVNAVKYPPAGARGVGLARAQKYGFGFDEYKKWLQTHSLVIVQIEHIKAIENLEDILSTPGVDGSIIGPYDLSGSLGWPGEFERLEVKAALERYEKVCDALGKPKGIHVVQPDSEKTKFYLSRGYSFIAVGLDTLYLGHKCREVMGEICK